MLIQPTRRAIFCALLSATLICGCEPSLENHPLFREHADRFSETQADVNAMRHQMMQMEGDLTKIRLEMGKIAKMQPAGPDAATGQRIDGLESSLKATMAKLETIDKKLDEFEKARKTAVVNIAAKSGPPVESKAVTAKTESPTRAIVKPKIRMEPIEPLRPKGIYYQVKAQETLEDVARRHNVPVSRLREANRIPVGREILPGQNIYVPIASR
jgi:LysM repeat protein